MKYRKKPVVIEAMKYDGYNYPSVQDWMAGEHFMWPAWIHNYGPFEIDTLEGKMIVSVGDYVIKGVKGEFYPCKPDIFEKTYEPTDAPAASPWHKVEEPPKEEGVYIVAVFFSGHWILDAAWFTHDITEIYCVPCEKKISGFYRGNHEVHPDYWMPIEPPKEDT